LLEYTVESLSAQLKAVNTQIADVTNEIVALTTTGNSLSKQLTTLNGKEEEIRDSRSFDERSHSVHPVLQ
jgi:septal ring factor EnvC (AmiA/AmiB activator)